MKRCPRCGETKSLDQFGKRTGSRAGEPRGMCKPCAVSAARSYAERNPEQYAQTIARQIERERQRYLDDPDYAERKRQYAKKWREENYDRYRASVEDAGLRRRYGMGRAELEAMLASQGGKCLLCARDIDWKTRHVDHIDTPDGPLVRGILCMPCNTGLGVFKENADLLRAAAEYVARYAPQEVR